jgi:hypothetical protein
MPQVLLLTASPFLCHQDRVNGYSWAVFVAILGSQSYCQMDWTSVTAVLRLDSTSILTYTSGGGGGSGGRIHRNRSSLAIDRRARGGFLFFCFLLPVWGFPLSVFPRLTLYSEYTWARERSFSNGSLKVFPESHAATLYVDSHPRYG